MSANDSTKRARIAYDAFRSGFDHNGRVPHWNDAPAWVRDVVIVAYLQGTLDSPLSRQHQIPADGYSAPEGAVETHGTQATGLAGRVATLSAPDMW